MFHKISRFSCNSGRQPTSLLLTRAGASSEGADTVPITRFLVDRHFDAETRRVMGVAFEMARSALRLGDGSDPVMQVVVEKIIELAQAGERDPNDLCERTLSFFRERLGRGSVASPP
jgi:hypothetical protein